MIGSTHVFTRTDFGFTDPQDMPNPNSLYSVIVTAGLSAAVGRLTYNGVPVTAPTVILAIDIDFGRLVYAAPNFTGDTSFNFEVQDDGGTFNVGTDTDLAVRTLNLLVGQALSFAPAGNNGTVTAIEDAPYAFQAGDFGFSDPDNPANNFYAVKITALPASGLLTDNNVAVAANQFVTVGDILLGKFRYVPPANVNGSTLASFSSQVQDDGGSTFGGQDLDSTPNTLTINVQSVNDTPLGADG